MGHSSPISGELLLGLSDDFFDLDDVIPNNSSKRLVGVSTNAFLDQLHELGIVFLLDVEPMPGHAKGPAVIFPENVTFRSHYPSSTGIALDLQFAFRIAQEFPRLTVINGNVPR